MSIFSKIKNIFKKTTPSYSPPPPKNFTPQISSSTPVASAMGGGYITAGGTVVGGSTPSAGPQSSGGGGGNYSPGFQSIPGQTPPDVVAASSQNNNPTTQQLQAASQGFSGSVQEYNVEQGKQTPVSTRYFVRNKETGSIQINKQGQQYAVVNQPSRFAFVNEERGTVQSVLLGEEGARIIDETQVSIPELTFEDTTNEKSFVAKGFWFDEPGQSAGVQWFLSDSKGNIIRKATREEAAQLKGQPTGYLTASTKKRESELYGNLTNSIFYRTNIASAISKISKPISYFNIEKRFPEERFVAGTLPVVPVISPFMIPSNVKLIGYSQNVNQDLIRTEALYESTRKGFFYSTTERGIVKSISQINPYKEDYLIKTIGVGKRLTNSNKLFGSVEVGILKQQGGKFGYVGTGKIAQDISKKSNILYRAYGSGIQKGEYSLAAGQSISRLGRVNYGALIKQVSSQTKYSFSSSVSNIPSNYINVAKQQALVSTIKYVPISQGKLTPVITYSLTSTTSIQTTSTTSIQKLKTSTKQTQYQIPKLKQTTGQTTKQVTKQIPSFKQTAVSIQLPKQLSKTNQLTNQLTIQKTLQSQQTRILQIQQPQTKPFSIPKSSARIFPKGITSFKFKTKSKPKTSFGKFPTLLRRFGKFNIIGYGRTLREAIGIGRQAASTTLGATFKVPGAKSFNIPGFKTKKSKKEGIVFIEKPKYRLSTGSELKEIQAFKRLKGGRR